MFDSINFLGIFRGLNIMTFGLFVNCAVSGMIAGRKKLVDFKEISERRAYIFFWMYMISLTLYVSSYAADFGADCLISGTAGENLKACSAIVMSVSAYVSLAALISLWKLFFRRKRKSDGRD